MFLTAVRSFIINPYIQYPLFIEINLLIWKSSYLCFEELWYIYDYGECGHRHGVDESSVDWPHGGVELPVSVRVTDGHVTLNGDGQGHVDGASERHGGHGVHHRVDRVNYLKYPLGVTSF